MVICSRKNKFLNVGIKRFKVRFINTAERYLKKKNFVTYTVYTIYNIHKPTPTYTALDLFSDHVNMNLWTLDKEKIDQPLDVSFVPLIRRKDH